MAKATRKSLRRPTIAVPIIKPKTGCWQMQHASYYHFQFASGFPALHLVWNHIHCPNMWVIRMNGVWEMKQLRATGFGAVDEAKEEALALLKGLLADTLNQLNAGG